MDKLRNIDRKYVDDDLSNLKIFDKYFHGVFTGLSSCLYNNLIKISRTIIM